MTMTVIYSLMGSFINHLFIVLFTLIFVVNFREFENFLI